MLRRAALVLLCTLACAACEASASIASARDASTASRLQRLYVTVDQGTIDPLYAKSLGGALHKELHARGVVVRMRILQGLDLDERAVLHDLDAWGPDGVLIVNFAGGSGIGVDLESATYDISLIETIAKRRI